MGKHKEKVFKERHVNTYSEMWIASYAMLKKAKEAPEGSYYQLMASLIFTAFTLEAFLNHIGQNIFKCWEDLDKLSPSGKLNLIAEKLEIERNDGKRPFQTVIELFKFRNDVAHGKTVHLKFEGQIAIADDKFDQYMFESLQTPWQQYCNLKNAERAREDVEKICRIIHEASDITDDTLFSLGMQTGLATLRTSE